MTTADDILSAQLVLGLLDGPDAAQAEGRAASDAGFARRVARWEDDLAVAFAAPSGMPAPDHVLDNVRRQLFGAEPPPARARGPWAGLPWGRILGGMLAFKMVAIGGVLGWNTVQTSHTGLDTRWGPAELAWHAGQGRVRLTHAGPEDLQMWVEEAGGLRFLGGEDDWIHAGLPAGSVVHVGRGRPAGPDGATTRIVLGDTT